MATMVSARVPDETARELRACAQDEERSVSEIMSRAIQEYVRAARFPGILFVSGANGRRRARLAGGPDVWEVVLVGRDLAWDPEKTGAHLGIPAPAARSALAFYAAYPDEIDARLKRLDELDADPRRAFPGIRVFAAEPGSDAASA